MESMWLFCVKTCWGNNAFDFVHSDSVGNSGGILCAWDPNSFRKVSSTVSDYFVMVRGVWLKTGVNLLIVVIYAPHDLRDKRMLWDYLENVANLWDGGLEEVPLGGSVYTWCHKSASKMSKLDRFLISENLMNSSPNISAITLDRFLSDHRPILLRESTFDYAPVPFRFFHHWLELDDFNNFVVDMWNIAPGDATNGMRNIMYKLKFLKSKIRDWNYSHKKNMKGDNDKLKEEHRVLDDAIDSGKGFEESVEGDENSRFFHGMLNKKRSQMSIRGVLVDDVWIEKPDQVKAKFFLHFSSRFGRPMGGRATVDMSYPKSLTLEQQEDLERPVSKEELKKAVWDCVMEKSPRPDGFTFGFYRHFWATIEYDVLAVVNQFFTYGDIPKGCNSSFIALIPKIPDADMVKDFRPISLIGSIYKIVAKILANRLVSVLGDIVSEEQYAFIAGRQILDGLFILNEVIQWCTLKKKQAVIFKVDFEKAFDSVRWDLLDVVLSEFGFGNNPTKEFQFFGGLKQGDPLSPFLFILIMESLHLSFQRVVDAGMFMGINLSPSLNLSHMFFTDDAVFVGRWCDSNIDTLVNVLECFYRAFCLRINISKSKIMGVHMEDFKVKQAAAKLGCLILNTHFTYLGTKVGGNMSRVDTWKEVIDKVNIRLSKWKMKTISIGGRLTLLKSVLGSLPVFHMSIYKVPKSVLQSLESIRSHFFNGHDITSRKASWVKWSNVLTAKDKGGLGVASLYALNRGLMLKWVWRFYSQKKSLWARVVKAIHGKEGRLGMGQFFDHMRLNLGDGVSTSFWEDKWNARGVLKDLFPRVYALEKCKKASVCTKLMDLESSLRRSIRGGVEQSQFNDLSELIGDIILTSQADMYVWSLGSSGDYSVASMRKVIDDNRSLNVFT
nr:putative RNA-directed DNA polymerase, eukaryota, reverse transcriptase zinc-binding domain protein [Tanacetum cinerariifolium]